MKKLYIVIPIIMIFMNVMISLPAHAQESILHEYLPHENFIVHQGDTVIVENVRDETIYGYSRCSVGYVDRDEGVFYMAGHCTKGNDNLRVLTEDSIVIGETEETPYVKDKFSQGKDIERVKITNGFPGENSYSGDEWVDPDDVSLGNKICAYGGNSTKHVCGEITGKIRDRVFYSEDIDDLIAGDSGSPVWVPEKGFIGMYTGEDDLYSYFIYPDMDYSYPLSNKFTTLYHDFKYGLYDLTHKQLNTQQYRILLCIRFLSTTYNGDTRPEYDTCR